MTVVRRTIAVILVLLAPALAGACASRATPAGNGPVPRPFPGGPVRPEPAEAGLRDGAAGPDDTIAAAPGSPAVTTLVATALGLTGTPYRFGGSDPAGFDCSGFVQYVFARHGLALPRDVQQQYEIGDDVHLKDVEPGDLIFFETVRRGPSHVGMAIGDDRFVHAPSSRGVVRVETFSSSYWASRFVGARRVSP